MTTPPLDKTDTAGSVPEVDAQDLDSVDLETPVQSTDPQVNDLDEKSSEPTPPAHIDDGSVPTQTAEASTSAPLETPNLVISSQQEPTDLPSVSETPTDAEPSAASSTLSLPKARRAKRSPSFALSMSSVNSTGQQTISSSVFIKNALETISKHKATAKNPALESSCSKALSKYHHLKKFLKC